MSMANKHLALPYEKPVPRHHHNAFHISASHPSDAYKELVRQYIAKARKPYGVIPPPRQHSLRHKRKDHPAGSNVRTRTASSSSSSTASSSDECESFTEKSGLRDYDVPLEKKAWQDPEEAVRELPQARYTKKSPAVNTPTSTSPNSPPNASTSVFPVYRFSISPPGTASFSLRSFIPSFYHRWSSTQFTQTSSFPPPISISPPKTAQPHLFTFLDDIVPVVAKGTGRQEDSASTLTKLLHRHRRLSSESVLSTSSSSLSTENADYLFDRADAENELDGYLTVDSGYMSEPTDYVRTKPIPVVGRKHAPSLFNNVADDLEDGIDVFPQSFDEDDLTPPVLPLSSKDKVLRSTQSSLCPATHNLTDDVGRPRPRDLRTNSAHLRMITAELNMMRARKLVSPLKCRVWLPRRLDGPFSHAKSKLSEEW
ncbi:hypothetical protein BZG36_02231 [Bifiguratus adelaidae]|uniref:Uncharacterized protein n=1 Tax=Bifiguratus adelaidae TaxID=1938954 RepID=A0A261Y3F6_9FUNG|nr:hypothetical protein BZG36_02231 [Bifiguratus adelaidae]